MTNRVVRLDVITTRGGDGGETSLGDGSRVRKDTLRIEAIGAVDETNAAIGLVRASLGEDAMLARVQNELFDLGADLCVPGAAGDRLRITDDQCGRLEQDVAAMNGQLPPLTSFILPGGSAAAAQAHLARTIARRAERVVVALSAMEEVNPAVIRYLNRLSDFLFVFSRRCNAGRAGDLLWTPGASR